MEESVPWSVGIEQSVELLIGEGAGAEVVRALQEDHMG
jgi:hypothetical protein